VRLVEQHPVPQVGVEEVGAAAEEVFGVLAGERLVDLGYAGRGLEPPLDPQPARRRLDGDPGSAPGLVGGDEVGDGVTLALAQEQVGQPVGAAVGQRVGHPAAGTGGVAGGLGDERARAVEERQPERRGLHRPPQAGHRGPDTGTGRRTADRRAAGRDRDGAPWSHADARDDSERRHDGQPARESSGAARTGRPRRRLIKNHQSLLVAATASIEQPTHRMY
jgi:hypothetical protein